ncbi:hypothetical protein A5776_23405 [Mycolicibacterium elephantis]|uniref:hypothetical protein n=1 Tax=Mycolicibacterium elephantis TaxID=81858 RepID=UPI0007EA0136|nr:hypothetical protein [Mycolicibacterium elephantis]OBE94327.1 hypothetical protein A5776_23405 [Mycolicibacterium elephantis]
MARQKVVHGDDLLYRFFVDLFESEPELVGVVPQLLVQSMAIWLPLDAYRHSPILLPWVVRDPTCRGSKARNIPDEWGSPNGDGFFRDDNSLVKSVPRSLNIRGPKGSRLNGRRMGSEFVAAHIWRKVDSDRLASRIPLLNTFVPNLVWLPSQVSKLSDLEGGIVQQTLQAVSRQIYSEQPVSPHLEKLVSEAWSLLPEPAVSVDVDVSRLNWFVATDRFHTTRRTRLSTVIDALETLEAGGDLTKKVISTRYTAGLPSVDGERRRELLRFLRRFAAPNS